MKHPNSAGYSLLELLVVLAVLGLITALAAPVAVSSVERMTLTADGRTLATHLRAWRDNAIDQQMEIVITAQGDAGLSASTGAKLILSKGTTVETIEGGRFAIGPDGGAEGGLRLSRGGASLHIRMSRLTGRIAIERAR